MRRALAVFLLVAGAFASLASVGFHISDEATLGAAARSLYAGELAVRDVPLEYYEPYGWGAQHAIVVSHDYVTETRGGAVFSFPAYVMLRAWSTFAPIQLLLVLLTLGALASGIGVARAPAWRGMGARRRRTEQAALGFGTMALLAANAALVRPIDALWLAPLAMQGTSLVVLALGIALLDALAVAMHGSRAASWITLTLSGGTTISFWAFGQKYHAMVAGLLCAALYFRLAPARGAWQRPFAYLVLGIAVWVHPRAGGLTLLAFLVVDVARALLAWRAWRRVGVRVLACGAALVLGLAGFAAENTMLYGNPVVTGYSLSATVTPSPGAAADAGATHAAPVAADTLRVGLGGLAAPEPGAPALAMLYRTWISPGALTDGVDVQYGVLMLSPLLALAPFAWIARRRELGPLDAILLTQVALVLVAYGTRAAAPGQGSFDSRYLHVTFPALAWASGLMLARAMAPAAALVRIGLPLAVASALTVSAVVFAALPPDFTLQFHLIGRLGITAAALLAAWAAWQVFRGAGHPLVGVPVIGLGLVATSLFLLQFGVHHPPRGIGAASHVLPLTQLAHKALATAWGA